MLVCFSLPLQLKAASAAVVTLQEMGDIQLVMETTEKENLALKEKVYDSGKGTLSWQLFCLIH